MGLLDDLRKQSEELKAKEDQEGARREQAEKVYREQLQPKLNELYVHLKELTDHLNYIKPNTKANYIVNAEGMQKEFLQGDYSVSIDSTDDTGLVALRFNCTRPEPVEFTVRDPNLVSKHVGYLNQYNLVFEGKKQADDRGNIIGAYFKLKPYIPIEVLFRGDRENACVNLVISNFDVLGRSTHVLQAEKFTDDFIDQFDRFIIRENPDMFSAKVDDKVKEELRAKLQEEQKRREEEMEEIERLQKEEEARQKEEKLAKLNKGFDMLKKFPKAINTDKLFGKFSRSESQAEDKQDSNAEKPSDDPADNKQEES